jgi:Ala-tRNA(Pro) deacylase
MTAISDKSSDGPEDLESSNAPAPPHWEARLVPAPEREAALYARFESLGIAWTTHEHAPVFTVEEARGLRGSLPGMHTKNLFLKDKAGGLWLVVAREELAVDLNALSKSLSAPRFSFAKPELLVAALGIAPGAVTPFALLHDTNNNVSAVFDAGMMEAALLNFHPLRNDRTTAIAPADLVKFAQSTGHAPLIAPIPERAA